MGRFMRYYLERVTSKFCNQKDSDTNAGTTQKIIEFPPTAMDVLKMIFSWYDF
jgi:hypothetical protein